MRDRAKASGFGAAYFRSDGAGARVRRAASAAGAARASLEFGARVIVPSPAYWARLHKRPIGGWSKRIFDIVGASGALIVLAPFLALIWIAVRIDRGGGSAIFKQERGGFGGRSFTIYKFRTMTCAENGADVRQVCADDARVTRLGALLRQTSWDELPQLINVLKGDMSLIGPRPHALEHDRAFAKIDPSYRLRFHARPGITGLAQVSGSRGPTVTDEHVKARTAWDVRYVTRWSFQHDLEVLWRTLLLFAKRDPQAI